MMMPHTSQYFKMCCLISQVKLAPYPGGSGPSPNIRFLGPSQLIMPNGISLD